MIRQLPRFSFKQFLRTRVVEVEKPEDLVNSVVEEIKSASNHATEDLVRLVVFTIYADIPEVGPAQYELRAWVSPDKVSMVSNIDEKFSPDKAYRIVIEEFEVAAIAASYDADSASHLGFELVIVPIDERLLTVVHRILNIRETQVTAKEPEATPEAPATIEEAPTTEQPAPPMPTPEVVEEKATPVSVRDLMPAEENDHISECLAKIWGECVYQDCKQPNNIIEALKADGFVIVGRGSEYICVLQGKSRQCKYFMLIMGPGTIDAKCFRKEKDVAKFLDQVMKKKGYLRVLS